MRKLFLLLITVWALLYCSPSYRKIIPPDKINVKMQAAQQQAYWLYFGTTDKVAVRPQDAIGRMKRGDLVQALPVSRQFRPTAKEQQAFAIIKVTGITKREIEKYTRSWDDTLMISGKRQIKHKSYRKWKTNLSALGIKRGLDTTAINFSLVRAKMRQKTTATLLGYERKCNIERYVNNPIRKIFNWTIPKVYAAEQISSCNKVGADFISIVAWEAAKDGAMTTGNPVVLELYDDLGILKNSTRVDIDGWTNNVAGTEIIIRTAAGEKHTGTDSTGFQRENTGTSDSFLLRESYTIIDGLDINHGNSGGRGFWLFNGGNIEIKNCILWNGGSDCIEVTSGADGNVTLKNNLIYDFSSSGIVAASHALIYYNTVYNNGSVGVWATDVTIDSSVAVGNASFDNAAGSDWDYFGVTLFKKSQSKNNCSSDGTANTGNLQSGIINKAAIDNFTDPTIATHAYDLSVKNNSADIYNAGADLSGTVDDDIIGITRPQSTSFDIGAFEFPVAGGGTTIKRRRLIF